MADVKKEGVKLGSARPGHWEGREHLRGTRKAIKQSTKLRQERTEAAYRFIMPALQKMRLEGKTMGEIATWLNDHDHRTTVGRPFTETAVWRLLKRYAGDDFLGRGQGRACGTHSSHPCNGDCEAMKTKQAPPQFPPISRYQFVAGPYKAPVGGDSVRRSAICYHGDVVVVGMTQAPIRWPGFHIRGRHCGLMPILFDGLVRAVVEEPEIAVAHFWGVARGTVDNWRRIIAGCEDSNAVFTALSILRSDQGSDGGMATQVKFTPKMLRRLKGAYNNGCGVEVRRCLCFDGKSVVGYAKYLIEYLEG